MRYLFIFLLFCSLQSFAQQNAVDSIIRIIEKSKTKTGVDTILFETAYNAIRKTALNDVAINNLEKASTGLTTDPDDYFGYSVKDAIFYNLAQTDKYKAIDYGKHWVELLEKSKRPNALIVRSDFFRQLRIPYRTSDKLYEGFGYFNEKLKTYKSNNDSAGLSVCYTVLSGFNRIIGLVDQSIYDLKKSLTYIDTVPQHEKNYGEFKKSNGYYLWANNNGLLGAQLILNGEYESGIKYLNIYRKNPEQPADYFFVNLALAKIMLNQLDSVPSYLDSAETIAVNTKLFRDIPFILQTKAFYKIKTGALQEAEMLLQKCHASIDSSKLNAFTTVGTVFPDYYLALIRIQQNRWSEARDFLKKDIIYLRKNRLEVLRDDKLLAEVYKKIGDIKGAYETNEHFIALQDSLLADQNRYRNISFETEQQINEKELSINKLQSESKVSTLIRNFTFGIVALLSILAGFIYYRFKTKQKDNLILQEQKVEIQSQRTELQKSLTELKSTQNQLIQKEKLASLGELTAGIAHEIQNPLNFVNNFSELSIGLAKELKEEVEKFDIPAKDKEYVGEIVSDLNSNQEKINHHGKRASSIVKGMLEHSRTSTGEREPTDINKLADEYLRLSYHGLRAKDKNFNSDYKTDFDESLPKLNVVPQDIGRVILNLINNAFYAVNERAKQQLSRAELSESLKLSESLYAPLVTVSTKHIGDKIEISIKDNGNGIPEKIKDKIFQPFFTTKPTGEGTGLGLSLSYDIVTKGHGGELKVESEEGKGSEFIIKLKI